MSKTLTVVDLAWSVGSLFAFFSGHVANVADRSTGDTCARPTLLGMPLLAPQLQGRTTLPSFRVCHFPFPVAILEVLVAGQNLPGRMKKRRSETHTGARERGRE